MLSEEKIVCLLLNASYSHTSSFQITHAIHSIQRNGFEIDDHRQIWARDAPYTWFPHDHLSAAAPQPHFQFPCEDHIRRCKASTIFHLWALVWKRLGSGNASPVPRVLRSPTFLFSNELGPMCYTVGIPTFHDVPGDIVRQTMANLTRVCWILRYAVVGLRSIFLLVLEWLNSPRKTFMCSPHTFITIVTMLFLRDGVGGFMGISPLGMFVFKHMWPRNGVAWFLTFVSFAESPMLSACAQGLQSSWNQWAASAVEGEDFDRGRFWDGWFPTFMGSETCSVTWGWDIPCQEKIVASQQGWQFWRHHVNHNELKMCALGPYFQTEYICFWISRLQLLTSGNCIVQSGEAVACSGLDLCRLWQLHCVSVVAASACTALLLDVAIRKFLRPRGSCSISMGKVEGICKFTWSDALSNHCRL